MDLDKDKYLTPAPNLRRTRASHDDRNLIDSVSIERKKGLSRKSLVKNLTVQT